MEWIPLNRNGKYLGEIHPQTARDLLKLELEAFDEVVHLQNLAEQIAFDAAKFLEECHKNETDIE